MDLTHQEEKDEASSLLALCFAEKVKVMSMDYYVTYVVTSVEEGEDGKVDGIDFFYVIHPTLPNGVTLLEPKGKTERFGAYAQLEMVLQLRASLRAIQLMKDNNV